MDGRGGESGRGESGGTKVVWRKFVLNGAPRGGEGGGATLSDGDEEEVEGANVVAAID